MHHGSMCLYSSSVIPPHTNRDDAKEYAQIIVSKIHMICIVHRAQGRAVKQKKGGLGPGAKANGRRDKQTYKARHASHMHPGKCAQFVPYTRHHCQTPHPSPSH
jgi:hypothetical protein